MSLSIAAGSCAEKQTQRESQRFPIPGSAVGRSALLVALRLGQARFRACRWPRVLLFCRAQQLLGGHVLEGSQNRPFSRQWRGLGGQCRHACDSRRRTHLCQSEIKQLRARLSEQSGKSRSRQPDGNAQVGNW